MVRIRRKKINKGNGLINSIMSHLSVELHLPGYTFCGPDTKQKNGLARSEREIYI